MTREELQRRQAAYQRFRWIAGAIAAAPLVVVYFLVHTRYLQGVLPESKLLSLLILVGVPIGWLLGVPRIYAWWAARKFGLQCPGCGHRLVDDGVRQALDRSTCRRCGAEFGEAPRT